MAIDISIDRYRQLRNTKFVGQSRVVNNVYYIYIECDGTLYRIKRYLATPASNISRAFMEEAISSSIDVPGLSDPEFFD